MGHCLLHGWPLAMLNPSQSRNISPHSPLVSPFLFFVSPTTYIANECTDLRWYLWVCRQPHQRRDCEHFLYLHSSPAPPSLVSKSSVEGISTIILSTTAQGQSFPRSVHCIRNSSLSMTPVPIGTHHSGVPINTTKWLTNILY